jgi:hypothetical protein
MSVLVLTKGVMKVINITIDGQMVKTRKRASELLEMDADGMVRNSLTVANRLREEFSISLHRAWSAVVWAAQQIYKERRRARAGNDGEDRPGAKHQVVS